MFAIIPYRSKRIEGHHQADNQFESCPQEEGDEGHGGYLGGMSEVAPVEYLAQESTHEGTQDDSPRHEEHPSKDA